MNEKKANDTISCPSCNASFSVAQTKQKPRFCPFCSNPLFPHLEPTLCLSKGSSSTIGNMTLVKGHLPPPETIQFSIGPYQVLRSIGRGGMGEVFLAYDTVCGRRIALKKIRTDLLNHGQLYNRFLKEAHITSQLTHPAIIPIYTVHEEEDLIYYTMPFVEGNTFKQILRNARQKERAHVKADRVGSAIPALLRIFITICQAIAYAHSKGVLHRDIKPENIIIGRYGEVLLLDWGLAKLITDDVTMMESPDSYQEESEELHTRSHPLADLTRIGKVVGTISYMAPERAFGHQATVQTDIYALGVILYQILTLQKPFQRGTLKDFRKTMHQEVLIDPAQIAPYRDVPPMLSRMVEKTLAKDPQDRYESVDQMIHDLETYLEGRAEWYQVAQLDINKKDDWIFQENVLIADHIAIMRHLETSDWVSLMISRASYPENIKIETTVHIGEKGNGIGFLLALPEGHESVHLNEGYYLWLGSDLYKSTKLLRSRVEVMSASEIYLKRERTYRVCIEKIDTHLHFYLDDVLQFSYISHLPLTGTHIGLLARDADFSIGNLNVFVSSHTIMVKCLAVPDAFLAQKDYEMALKEYRRIAYSFPGRAEGREALFRAGITLLEQGNHSSEPSQADQYYDLALAEFEKLHKTAGAPLGYLGKALVYERMKEYSEEIKCFELAYRRYPGHPLLPVLQEQIVYRMHECSHKNRVAAYQFILLAIRYLPIYEMGDNTKRLFEDLQRHWEELPFIEKDSTLIEPFKSIQFGIQLAFWLAQPYVLEEMIDKLLRITICNMTTLGNALFSLLELNEYQLIQRKIAEIHTVVSSWDIPESDRLRWQRLAKQITMAINHRLGISDSSTDLLLFQTYAEMDWDKLRSLLMIMSQSIDEKKTDRVHWLAHQIEGQNKPHEIALTVDSYRIWAYLLEKNWDKAGELLHQYSIEVLHKETSILHFLYGCWLHGAEGNDIAYVHFFGMLDVPYPRSWALFGHFLKNGFEQIPSWSEKAFLWEKKQLYRQAVLYYHCTGDSVSEEKYQKLLYRSNFKS